MSDFYTVLLSGLERVKSKLGGIPTVHVCLVPLTVLLCLPGGSFHSPRVPGEDASCGPLPAPLQCSLQAKSTGMSVCTG